MLPERSITRIAAVSLPNEFWSDLGFTEMTKYYVEQIFAQVGHPFDLRVCVRGASRNDLISTEDVFELLDFTNYVQPEGCHSIALKITQTTRLDGFFVWLNVHVDHLAQIDILDAEYCWLPVFLPVFYPGVAVFQGDQITATITRRLNANGVNPDYELHGVLQRQNAEDIPFTFSSIYNQRNYRASLFYQALFANNNVPLRVNLPLLSVNAEYTVEPEPPANELEAWICAIWQDVLKRDSLSVIDHFDAVGGHSLAAIEIITRLQDGFGYEFDVKAAFMANTIRAMANVLTQAVNPLKKEA